MILWVPSQNGRIRDLPQRHSATVRRPTSISLPSWSASRTGPRTSSGPSRSGVIVAVSSTLAPYPRRDVRHSPRRASNPCSRPGRPRYAWKMLLEGRKLLVTGVLTESSIAFSIARRAQEEGAEIVLTGFGRGLRITQRVARRLPTEPDVLELDVNDPEQLEATAGEIEKRWGRLDGLVHAIAFVPGDALGGNFLTAPSASAL